MKTEEPQFERMAIENLVKAPWNYKSDDKQKMEKLVRAIHKDGMIQNLIVRELETGAFEIVNGNHRYDALIALKRKRVWVCNLGKISEKAAQAVAFRTNDLMFDNDELKMAEILRGFSKEMNFDEMVQDLPFTEKRLNKLLQLDSWPTVQKSPRDDGETILLKIPVTQDQMQKWLEFKMIVGTDNDTAALLKAVEAFVDKQ
ncbi:MAG: ParB/RepB/Spo0J family partition protein [Candidatus Pacebacteria bacterium]|nr:ParB/RepB/Spo0J family partition protein [Candidatus Paceibacterota bacterium]